MHPDLTEAAECLQTVQKRIAPAYLNGMEYNATTKLPKYYRCKGRKRYIKLLMSEGVKRNWAKYIADSDCMWYGSYSTAWRIRCLNRENPGRVFV